MQSAIDVSNTPDTGVNATRPRIDLAVLFAITVLAVVAIFRFLSGFEIDELENLQIAWLIGHGWLPYRDFFELHPPFFHFLLSVLVRNLSSVDVQLLLTLRVIAFLVQVVCIFGIFKLAEMIMNRKSAGWACLAYVCLLPFEQKFVELRADWVAEAAILWATVLLGQTVSGAKNRALPAGILFGMSLVCTQKSFGLVPAVLLWLFLSSVFGARNEEVTRRLSILIRCGVAMAAVVVLASTPFILHRCAHLFWGEILIASWRWCHPNNWQDLWGLAAPCSLLPYALASLVVIKVVTQFPKHLRNASLLSLIALMQLFAIAALLRTPCPYEQAFLFLITPFSPILFTRGVSDINKGLSTKDLSIISTILVLLVLPLPSQHFFAIKAIAITAFLVAALFLVSEMKTPMDRRLAVCYVILLTLPLCQVVRTAVKKANATQSARHLREIGELEKLVPPGRPIVSWDPLLPFRPVATFNPMVNDESLQFMGQQNIEQQYINALQQRRANMFVADTKTLKKLPAVSLFLRRNAECECIGELRIFTVKEISR